MTTRRWSHLFGLVAAVGFTGSLSWLAFSSRLKPKDVPRNAVVYRAMLDEIAEVPAQAAAPEGSARELPDSLAIPPGTYAYHGRVYNLSREGLYRFMIPWEENQQRIVYRGDIDALLSGVAWIFSHGALHDRKDYVWLEKRALRSKVVASCGTIAQWTRIFLEKRGIAARLVSLTDPDARNDYDSGHVLLEIYRPEYGKWTAYDPDNNLAFFREGIPLSLIELSELAATRDYQLRFLAKDTRLDVDGFQDSENGYDFTFFWEMRSANENALKRWYERMLQVPLIRQGDHYVFFNRHYRTVMEARGAGYMPPEEFQKTFYGPAGRPAPVAKPFLPLRDGGRFGGGTPPFRKCII